MATQSQDVLVYHERQESALCAKHCLNNLLQGPYFTEFNLSDIALELDAEENQLLAEDTESFMLQQQKTGSHNVDMDGNFSIQVIRRALGNLGLEIVDIGSKEATEASEHPERQEAFICNLEAHWFAVRKIGGTWYDLNSLSGLPETPAKPTTISDFYLNVYLSSLHNEGYSIFVVTGAFPRMPADHSIGLRANWYPQSALKSRSETYPKELQDQVNKSRSGRAVLQTNPTESELEKALQESLRTSGQGNNNTHMGSRNMGTGSMDMGMGMDADGDMEMALAMSMSDTGANNKSGSSGSSSDDRRSDNNNNNTNNDRNRNEDDEDELNKALLLSIQSDYEAKVPAEPDSSANPKDICEIKFRIPNSEGLERKFSKENTIGDIFNFIKSKITHQGEFELISPPSTCYKDETKKLGELDLGGKSIMTVKYIVNSKTS